MAPAEEKFYQARIVERQDLSEDLWTIRVDPGGEFHFRAGQYATLGLVTPEKHIERPYSIVSAPFEPYLEFFLERVPQGALTPMLFKCQVGDRLTIRKAAKGRFKRPIVTVIEPAQTFWPAEDYHQRYFEKHGGSCHVSFAELQAEDAR